MSPENTLYCERCEKPVTKGAHTCNAAKGWLIKQNKSLTDEHDKLLEALGKLIEIWDLPDMKVKPIEWDELSLTDSQGIKNSLGWVQGVILFRIEYYPAWQYRISGKLYMGEPDFADSFWEYRISSKLYEGEPDFADSFQEAKDKAQEILEEFIKGAIDE